MKKLFNTFFNMQFIKFGIVGVINTLNHQVIYLLTMNIVSVYIANMLGFFISMIGSFYMNTYFTYKTRPTFKKALLFPLTYLPTLFGSTIGMYILLNYLNVPKEYASFIATISMVPFSFLISKFILKNKESI